MRILRKLNYFLMTSQPLMMTSYQPETLVARFWVNLSEKSIVVGIRQSSCLLNQLIGTLFFDFKKSTKPEKTQQPDLFFHKVNYAESDSGLRFDGSFLRFGNQGGETVPFLFLQATSYSKRIDSSHLTPIKLSRNIFL